MKRFGFIILCLALATLAVGCKDKSRPADLPEDMSPCKITITQEGTPLAGATVELVYDTKMKYKTSGTTNESGVATMMTYSYPGAQQGTAKVVVTKLVTEGGSEGEDGEAGELGSDFQVVDAKYRKADTTDLTITIGQENVEQTFEVGAAVHDPVK